MRSCCNIVKIDSLIYRVKFIFALMHKGNARGIPLLFVQQPLLEVLLYLCDDIMKLFPE